MDIFFGGGCRAQISCFSSLTKLLGSFSGLMNLNPLRLNGYKRHQVRTEGSLTNDNFDTNVSWAYFAVLFPGQIYCNLHCRIIISAARCKDFLFS